MDLNTKAFLGASNFCCPFAAPVLAAVLPGRTPCDLWVHGCFISCYCIGIPVKQSVILIGFRVDTPALTTHCLRLKGRLRCPAVTLTATVDYVAWTIRTLRSRLLPLLSFLRFAYRTLARCSLYAIASVRAAARRELSREWLAGSFSKAPSIEQALSVKL